MHTAVMSLLLQYSKMLFLSLSVGPSNSPQVAVSLSNLPSGSLIQSGTLSSFELSLQIILTFVDFFSTKCQKVQNLLHFLVRLIFFAKNGRFLGCQMTQKWKAYMTATNNVLQTPSHNSTPGDIFG
jgi:hypothetical protein